MSLGTHLDWSLIWVRFSKYWIFYINRIIQTIKYKKNIYICCSFKTWKFYSFEILFQTILCLSAIVSLQILNISCHFGNIIFFTHFFEFNILYKFLFNKIRRLASEPSPIPPGEATTTHGRGRRSFTQKIAPVYIIPLSRAITGPCYSAYATRNTGIEAYSIVYHAALCRCAR